MLTHTSMFFTKLRHEIEKSAVKVIMSKSNLEIFLKYFLF